jgi:hypothetical protein
MCEERIGFSHFFLLSRETKMQEHSVAVPEKNNIKTKVNSVCGIISPICRDIVKPILASFTAEGNLFV